MSGNQGISGLSSSFTRGARGGAPIPDGGRKSGDIIFAADAWAILKKQDILRLERNNKRDERRKAGEKDVSDDEQDELTPLLLSSPTGSSAVGGNVPVGLAPAPPGDRAGSSAPLQPVPGATMLLFGDDTAEKNSFRAHDDSIPQPIFSLAKNGISPPLTLFLPVSLDRIRSSNVKTTKHGTGETARVTVLDLSDFPDEDGLDQATWATCYNTYLTFIEKAAGVKIFQGFARHFNQMLSDPDLALWFLAYRSFDKKVRAQFFTKPYIIDVEDIEYRSALQSAKNSFLMSDFFPAHSPSTPHSLKGREGFSGRDREDRSKPYDKDAPRKNSTLCFRCGRLGHSAIKCEEKEPSRFGRQFVVDADGSGLVRLSDARSVCIGFNCGKCEHSGGRQHPIHICSLCGDAHHGAVDCTRN